MRRNQLWTLSASCFLVLLCGLSVTPSRAQSTAQVWSLLQAQTTNAGNDGFSRVNYIIGWLDSGTATTANWPVTFAAGKSYLIVGVCDNDCMDLDLSLETKDRAVVASDLLDDSLPIIDYTSSSSATYWIRPAMVTCSVNPCGYGIAVFVK